MSHSGRHASRPPGDQTRSPSERARALRASRRISPRTRLVLTGLLLAGLAALLLTTVRPPADGTGGLTAIAETTTGTTTGTATGRAGFDLQGHRGARGLEPENTLPAFATALALGVTTLELDVGLTLDATVRASPPWRSCSRWPKPAAGEQFVTTSKRKLPPIPRPPPTPKAWSPPYSRSLTGPASPRGSPFSPSTGGRCNRFKAAPRAFRPSI